MDMLSAMMTFGEVVAQGSLSAAARRLGISKSAVSKQLARLEVRLGGRLLDRTTRRLAPTDLGRAFYERYRRVAAEVEEAEQAVSSLRGRACGTLRLNAPVSFGNLHLAPALPDFADAHPDLTLDLTLTDRYVDLIEEGYDAVLRVAAEPPAGLSARRIAGIRDVLCAAPAYLERRGLPGCPSDLARHNCLLYGQTRPVEDWRLIGPDGARASIRVAGNFRANNGDALRLAAVAGLGIALLPTFIAGPDLAAGRLTPVLPGHHGAPGGLFLLSAPGRFESPKIGAVGDFLAARFGGTPPWDAVLAAGAPAP